MFRKYVVLSTSVLGISVTASYGLGFSDLGTLGGNNSHGIAIGNGIVVGESDGVGGSSAHAFKYSAGVMSDLGTLGGAYSRANAISSDGNVIVGCAENAGSVQHAFKYTGGAMTDLGLLTGGSNSNARAVSASGDVIAGSATDGSGYGRAFRYTGGTMYDMGTLGGNNSQASGVSGDGSIIVGWAETAGINSHAFSYSGGFMTDLGTLVGGSTSEADAISADGTVIVGFSQVGSGNFHAFKYTGGTMTDIGTIGGTESYAVAVSANGSVIAGYATLPSDSHTVHAFRYADGVMTDIGTLGGSGSEALGISADGSVIVGDSSIAGDSAYHAFIYRTAMVDADNTVQAIANNAGQMHSLLNLKSSLLVNALDSDCSMYSDKGVCLAITGWHYSGQESDLAAQSATTLKASYRFSKNFRAGALMDLAFAQTNPDNFNVISKAPLFGGFAAYGDNETGNGVQLRLAAAYNEADATITRTVLANTEAGQGESTFNSFGAKAEAGYGKTFAGWKTLPYLGVQWTNVSRNAYGEISGATFPVVYNAIGQRQFTALAGIKTDKMIAAGFGLNGGIGVEQDINNSVDGYTGTMDTLGSFNLVRPHMNWTRPFANVGASYELAKDQRIGAGFSVRRQTLTNTYGTLVSGQYTIAF